jgi:hypothetical protein
VEKTQSSSTIPQKQNTQRHSWSLESRRQCWGFCGIKRRCITKWVNKNLKNEMKVDIVLGKCFHWKA